MTPVSRLDFVGEYNAVKLYTAVVNCVNLKRTIRVVYLLKNTGYAVLFSTDTELDALTLYRSQGTVSEQVIIFGSRVTKKIYYIQIVEFLIIP